MTEGGGGEVTLLLVKDGADTTGGEIELVSDKLLTASRGGKSK